MKTRWLLVSNGRPSGDLSAALASRQAMVDAVDRATEALKRAASGDYDGAVCIVEEPEDLAIVIRLKSVKGAPPLLMVTSSPNPVLRELGRRMGASAVISEQGGLDAVASALSAALETRRLSREQGERVRTTAALGHQVKALAEELKGRVAAARALVGRSFVVLLVATEDPPTPPLLRAFAEAGLPPFVRQFSLAEKAMDYLAGTGDYADRARHPLPSLVLADESLPGCGGLDLLAWMRMRSDSGGTPFILLSSRPRLASEADLQALEVEDCCPRTRDLAPLVERARAIHRRWQMADDSRPDA